ncbi:MAG TPA: class I SAM-dependent methyltransferase [Mariniphaga anaerophila]|uniref:Arsenite methyltransferase n=1 Tax=Mariniphaga anaerophila TaxID=1484053 RepID=A0A831LY46_9BACT|nr:class I SAM-dependent methyltransferase [Mariniphaga anaerophila]
MNKKPTQYKLRSYNSEEKTLEESVMASLDCSDAAILPWLPFILQDFWEMGSDSDTIIHLIKKHLKSNPAKSKVLDLGCGKGAISVKTAKKLGCSCLGIDAISEFIDFARLKANEYRVSHLCIFETGDIRKMINRPARYDIIISGAIGPVLGNYYETLTKLKLCLNETGIIIIDDGYIGNKSRFTHPQMLKKSELLKQVDTTGMVLADEVTTDAKGKKNESYDAKYNNLEERCLVLISMHPDKAGMFLNFLKKQRAEYNLLKSEITCSTMVFQRKTTTSTKAVFI